MQKDIQSVKILVHSFSPLRKRFETFLDFGFKNRSKNISKQKRKKEKKTSRSTVLYCKVLYKYECKMPELYCIHP